MIKDPEITKHLVISTIHVSQNDIRLLRIAKEKVWGIIADEYPYGYRVNGCFENRKHKAIRSNLMDKGFSKEFVSILFIAHKIGCKWVDFDQDGPEYSKLFKFKW